MKTPLAPVLCLSALLFAAHPAAAQEAAPATPAETEAHRAAIDAFYPVMIQALNDGEFDKARTLCRQAISWEPEVATHHYNLGCIEAKAGRKDAAFAALTEANRLGYSNTESLHTDTDLASLRGEARYNDIMHDAAQNAINQLAEKATPAPAPAPAPGADKQPMPAPGIDPKRDLTKPAAAAATGAATPPAAAKLGDNGPVGMYFMTRYWIATRSLERATWYFSPEGMAYENPTGDFSAASLAATATSQGKISLQGKDLVFTSTKGPDAGQETRSEYDPQDEGGFYWNTGSFIPVTALTGTRGIIGKWQGGFSVIGASVARTLELNADGTFSLSGAASLESRTDGSEVRAGSSGQILRGKWSVSGFFMTLTGSDGTTRRSVAFPWDDAKTPANPDKFFFDSIMWSPLE